VLEFGVLEEHPYEQDVGLLGLREDPNGFVAVLKEELGRLLR
jgi:hypothetical protein